LEVFAQAGLYDPVAPDAGQRRELLEHLVARGFSPEDIIEMSTRIRVTDLAVALTRRLPPLLSSADVAERCSTTVEEIASVRTALGFSVAEPHALDVPATFVEDFALYTLACEQYGRDRTLAFARVLGASIATLTEAARELFATPLREAGATELEVSEANEVGVAAWDSLPAIVGHLMVERTARDIWFEERLLTGDVAMAVAFVDLVGSTEWTQATSPMDRAAAIARFELAASRLAIASSGRVVKFIGDEAMIVAGEPEAAVTTAVRLCRAVSDDPDLPTARAAVAYGPVLAQGGDYFGPIVNLASRATKIADPGSVVITPPVRDALNPETWVIDNVRSVELRGFAEPVPLTTATPRDTNQT
jgi:adenylate cyclase